METRTTAIRSSASIENPADTPCGQPHGLRNRRHPTTLPLYTPRGSGVLGLSLCLPIATLLSMAPRTAFLRPASGLPAWLD